VFAYLIGYAIFIYPIVMFAELFDLSAI